MERDFIKKFDNLKEANLLNEKSANEKGRKTIGTTVLMHHMR